MPPNTVCVGRGSPYGNPFKVGDHWRFGAGRIETGNEAFNFKLKITFGDRPMTQEDCVLAYEIYLDYAGLPADSGGLIRKPVDLKWFNLACWCALDKPCHADVLLRRANAS